VNVSGSAPAIGHLTWSGDAQSLGGAAEVGFLGDGAEAAEAARPHRSAVMGRTSAHRSGIILIGHRRGGTGMAPLVTFTGVLGLLVGSFLNVVGYRLPRGESLARPPSHCPACGAHVRTGHNVPVVGWLVLRGRCADCRAPIPIRYPLVELATGIVFAGLTTSLDRVNLVSAVPAYLYFAAIGIALAMIDLDTRRLPSAIILPSYPVLAVLLTGSAWWQHDWWSLARAGVGGAALFAFFFALAFAHPSGMGFGDVRLSGIIGGMLGYLSWSALVIGAFGGFLLGAIVGMAVLASRKGDRHSALPFGPFMVFAALVAVVAADPIAAGYRHLLGA
jgi:leader peptidase (prepilin peptidase)/N-methyltransferase